MEYSKYIIPIYADSNLIGTGVLHNSLLITAAHVVESCRRGKSITFHFSHNIYTLNWSKKLFFEYDEEKMGVYRDLAIFKTEIDIKGLSFESEKLHEGKSVHIYGYYDVGNSVLVNQSEGVIRQKPYWDGTINIPINKNSFLLMDIPTLYECNSGCPLLLNGNVLGLVSTGNSEYKYCRLVSSSHIISVLSSI